MVLNHQLVLIPSTLLWNKPKGLSNILEFAKLQEANTTKIFSLMIIQQYGEVGITNILDGVIVAAIRMINSHIVWESKERKKH